jgi:hypothetical protein
VGVVVALLALSCLGGHAVAGEDPALPPPMVRRVRGPGGVPLQSAPVPGRPAPPASSGGEALPEPGPLPPPDEAFPPGPPPRPDGGPGAVRPPRDGLPPEPGPAEPALPDRPESGELPERPPPRPDVRAEPAPGEVGFQVARPGGLMRLYRDDEDPEHRRIVVMVGTPRIERPAHVRTDDAGRQRRVEELVVKANAIVAWVDRRGFPGVDAYGGLDLAGDGPAAAAVPEGGFPMGRTASVIPEFLLGLYAEGAVELTFGDQRFRAESLYLDPQAFKGLLVEPRVAGRARGIEAAGEEGIPLHLRARVGRLEARGLTVFEDAEVSTSRSDDRIALGAQTLRVQEFAERHGPDGAERPHFVGFQARSTQRYEARGITVRGERLPLVRVAQASFGLSDTSEGLPTLVRGARAGSRSHLGRFGFVELGGDLGPQGTPWGSWGLEAGGYTKRGPALLPEVRWKRLERDAPVRSVGKLGGFLVAEQADQDRTGFEPGEWRHRIALESRTWLEDDLWLDVEVNDFSDRGVNNEFFERDDLEHKDRESYARLSWAPAQPGTFVTTLTAKWHQRGFATETLEEPVAGLWVQSLPLLVPRSKGGLGLDLTTQSSAGRFRRAYDSLLALDDEAAWRFASTTRVHAAGRAGDLRLSGFGGIAIDHLTDLEGITSDTETTRSAFEAGALARLQLHRASRDVRGSWYQVDGLRHVIDLEAGYDVREGGGDALPGVYFDRREQLRDRQAVTAAVRQRWQTRRASGGLRDLLDARLGIAWWLDERGPYGRDAPGQAELLVRAEPREGLLLLGEADMDLDGRLASALAQAEVRTHLHGAPLRLSGGYRYVEDVSSAFTAEVGWTFSPRYRVEWLSYFEMERGEDLHRVLFHRSSADHVISFGVQFRNGSPQLEFAFSPAIGGRTTEEVPLFRDVFDPSTERSLSR